jgi:hypothetical protein
MISLHIIKYFKERMNHKFFPEISFSARYVVRITGFLDFVHHPILLKTRELMFWKSDLKFIIPSEI